MTTIHLTQAGVGFFVEFGVGRGWRHITELTHSRMIALRNAMLDGDDADVELHHELDAHTVERALTALKAAIRDREQALDRIFEIAEDEARATDGDCAAAEKSGYADFDLRPPIMEAAWSES